VSHRVFIERSAARSLSRITSPHRQRVAAAIKALSSDPRPSGVKKLIGRDAWRIRVGEYRVIYEIDDKASIILVVVVAPRQDAYRQ
jgi:mRNA interferase RelE/StbE